jgi:hypothetical protein
MIDWIIYLVALCKTQQEALEAAEMVIQEQAAQLDVVDRNIQELEADVADMQIMVDAMEVEILDESRAFIKLETTEHQIQ